MTTTTNTTSTIPTFEYSTRDFVNQPSFVAVKREEELVDIKADFLFNIEQISEFDRFLINRWLDAMRNGVFKFKLENMLETRYLSGKYSFLVTSHPNRYTKRRPTEVRTKVHIDEPFNPAKFNFTKIAQNEIICKIVRKSADSLTPTIDNDDTIIINNSPVDFAHMLIVPRLSSCLNQRIDAHGIRLAVECLLLSGSNNLIMGFNSLNAYASVNQCHLHAYYMENRLLKATNPLPIQSLNNAERLTTNLWFINDKDYYYPGFCLQLSDFDEDVQIFAESCSKITNYFMAKETPFNVDLIKADSFGGSKRGLGPTRDKTVKFFAWPKRPAYEFDKNEYFVGFACCELSGHFFVFDQASFENITEEFILNEVRKTFFSSEQMDSFKTDIIDMFL